jgi:hypothetical protein
LDPVVCVNAPDGTDAGLFALQGTPGFGREWGMVAVAPEDLLPWQPLLYAGYGTTDYRDPKDTASLPENLEMDKKVLVYWSSEKLRNAALCFSAHMQRGADGDPSAAAAVLASDTPDRYVLDDYWCFEGMQKPFGEPYTAEEIEAIHVG